LYAATSANKGNSGAYTVCLTTSITMWHIIISTTVTTQQTDVQLPRTTTNYLIEAQRQLRHNEEKITGLFMLRINNAGNYKNICVNHPA
jgi:hypothetical protein